MRSCSVPDPVRAVDVVVQGPGAARLQRLTDPAEVEAVLDLLQQLQARREKERRPSGEIARTS